MLFLFIKNIIGCVLACRQMSHVKLLCCKKKKNMVLSRYLFIFITLNLIDIIESLLIFHIHPSADRANV